MSLKSTLVMVCALINIASANITINEFHYDNTGSDKNEFIEIVSTELIASPDQVLIDFYNGGNGSPYKNLTLEDFSSHGLLTDNRYYYSLLVPGIQNGAPDGIAVSQNGAVLDFISYEGTFTATAGAATGLTSQDILVYEPTSTPTFSSLQRQCSTNAWILTEGFNTMGQINTGCAVPTPASVPVPGSGLLTLIALGFIQTTRKRLTRTL